LTVYTFMGFLRYYLEREIQSEAILSESLDLKPLYEKGVLKGGKKAVEKLLGHMRSSHLCAFKEKFPNAQHGDIEEAFESAVEEIMREKPRTEDSVERMFTRSMEKSLSELVKGKRGLKKKLSCVGAVKKMGDLDSLMKRAEKILTGREIRILRMCSQGKSVRVISSEVGASFPTVWRDLNSAIDKLRISHGMKSRHKDRRGS